jgi:hypothetical protein
VLDANIALQKKSAKTIPELMLTKNSCIKADVGSYDVIADNNHDGTDKLVDCNCSCNDTKCGTRQYDKEAYQFEK